MAKIGTLAGYNRVSEVPEDDYLMLENQLGFPLYVVAKEIVNAYRNDERVVMVTLSEEGHALRKKAIDVPKKLVASTQEVFTVHEAAELRKLLNKLLDTIDAAHGVINPEDIKR